MHKTLHLAAEQRWNSSGSENAPRLIIDVECGEVRFSQEGHDQIQSCSVAEFENWVKENASVVIAGPEASRFHPGLELGHRIRLLREMAGMSQQQLADAAGISRSAVAFWETGRSGHVGKHLGTLAGVLGVEPEVLLTGMAYKEIQATLTPDESVMVTMYRALDPLIKIQAQKWIERRVRQADEAEG
ncbi:helix-turn-helix domain-containing protein [Gluconobacter wancherniae]|uniref:HTH cro/C1-type domain-containing protein n=1 Tax=Gluconobacter wancherniae NBRC 103581 TaxID=656744 RepID=A0A511AWP5_9PROT|nr:helix-turn-helix domain-containing protein [Gluconobacter wancherniae]MBF0852820.1 helix-turn-helix domain-containing protein [Gluconobacter wancherniae]MBS1087707.1 helix-turn-helix domain-containing protein [Gluconobacter wancherniae]MBS1093389.1 helix-turn-helix domain-containing protein [Gluconobacter wancherniae]GBD56464.1 transcriptional regulator [Gluconobacter wancherniae NBRC 103581]GBR63916.1 transcriptional regulator [Gluconobacter wancherniae NBRC 103581]